MSEDPKVASVSHRLTVIEAVFVWLALPLASVALMDQVRVPVGGLGIAILSPSVSRFAYHLPATVWLSMGLDDQDVSPGRRKSRVTDATPSASVTTAVMLVAVWHDPTPSGSQDSEEPLLDDTALITGPVFAHTLTVTVLVPLAGSRRLAPSVSAATT